MILGVVLFALAIGLSIMLHEAGHLVTAKRFGMQATQFFVGFGPTLWSFRRGETEYGVKAIPAGGFVKITGMTPLEELAPADEHRAFYRQPAPQRAVVLAAGSAMHFVIAFVVLYIAAVGVGLPSDRAVVEKVSPCVVVEKADRACRAGDPVSPAVQAGLRAGDRVVAVNGRRVSDFEAMSRAIRAAGAGPATVTIVRDGDRRDVAVDLAQVTRQDFDDPAKEVQVGALGVAPERSRTYGPVEGVTKSAGLMGQLVAATGSAIQHFPEKVPPLLDAVTGGTRDPAGPVSVVGAAKLGGQAVAADQIVAGLGLLASLNVFIGIFNLFPLLPLDGGHLAILGFEKARSRIARALGRKDPGRVDIRKLTPIAYVVILIFGGISVLAITADFVNPIANPFQ